MDELALGRRVDQGLEERARIFSLNILEGKKKIGLGGVYHD